MSDEIVPGDEEMISANGQSGTNCPKCKAHYENAQDANDCCKP
jgi:hypothetical protein